MPNRMEGFEKMLKKLAVLYERGELHALSVSYVWGSEQADGSIYPAAETDAWVPPLLNDDMGHELITYGAHFLAEGAKTRKRTVRPNEKDQASKKT